MVFELLTAMGDALDSVAVVPFADAIGFPYD